MIHQLVPQFILQKMAADEEHGRFSAAALFVDISGFTTITETLMAHGQQGAEVLAEVMRAVFDPLVRAVYAQGGFITGFAGDAFTAVFPGRMKDDVGDIQEAGSDSSFIIHRSSFQALAAGWRMQQQMAANAQQNTRYGPFPFSARVGIAAGEVQWGILRSEKGARATYYFKGTAVDGCATAEKQAGAGEVVVDTAVYAAVGQRVMARPVAGQWQIRRITATLPRPGAISPPPQDAGPVARFFPPEIVTQTLSGEFRQTLNLFINLQGAPGHAQLGRFMETLFALQAQYGGLLNRIDFGDKGCHLLLFWGAPTSHENDVARVLNFILELREACELPLRAGLTYRIAHAGFVGSPLREEYTCYGRGVNLAARSMTAADWGEIWLDDEVARRAEGEFRVEYGGKKRFKGFAEPQTVFVLDGRRESLARKIYHGPLVGREAELARMREAAQPIFDGRFAGLLTITGEPGIGKSRLVAEFGSQLAEEAVNGQWSMVNGQWSVENPRWFLCQTDEILRQSLNPFRYCLRRYFEQSAARDEATNKRRFNEILDDLIAVTPEAHLAAELERTRPFLGALVGLHWPGSLYEQLEPQLRFENSLSALKSLFKAESLQQPLIIHLEDAHWLDGDSAQFLARLTRNVADFPFLLLLTSRGAPDAGLVAPGTPQQRIVLERLGDTAVHDLARSLLKRDPAPALVAFLEERTDGNPFFVEQMVLYLGENELLEQIEARRADALPADVYVPADVRAILVARLDRLSPPVKDGVQRAAVLGREFETRLLPYLLDDPSALERILQTAESESVWFPLDRLRYLFKHALQHNAVYDMQLRSRLRELHRRAAAAYETIQQPDVSANYGQIAYHYDKAEVVVKALDYYARAADQARENYRNEEALAYYGRALALAAERDFKMRYRLLLGREAVLSWLGEREKQQEDLRALAELLAEEGNGREQAELALRHSAYALTTGNYDQAIAAAERSATHAAQAGDQLAEAKAYHRWGRIFWQQGDPRKAVPYLQKALKMARAEQSREDEAQCLHDLGVVFQYQGDYAAAQRYGRQARAMYQALDDRQGEIRCYNLMGIIHYALGEYTRAHRDYEQVLALCQELGWRYAQSTILVNIGNSEFELGNYRAGRAHLAQAIHICREIGSKEHESVALDTSGLIAYCQGDLEAARRFYEESLAIARSINNVRGMGFTLTHLGYALVAEGEYTAAEQVLAEALTIRRDLQDGAGAVDALGGLALAALHGGRPDEARALVREILSWIEAHGLEGIELPVQIYLICYQVLQSAAQEAPRLQDEAQTVLAAGHALLQERAAHIQDADLRRAFLENVPFNRDLMACFS